jgi:hypothetical protein
MSIAENMLKPLFKKMAVPVAENFKVKNCDFAQILIKDKLIHYGIKETGEIIETIKTGDFAEANAKIANLVENSPDVSKFVSRILIFMEGETDICAMVESKILGNLKFKFNIENNGE